MCDSSTVSSLATMPDPSATPPEKTSGGRHRNPFADLRRHNDYAARVARAIESRRKRRIEQVMTVQRKHRTQQVR